MINSCQIRAYCYLSSKGSCEFYEPSPNGQVCTFMELDSIANGCKNKKAIAHAAGLEVFTGEAEGWFSSHFKEMMKRIT